LIEKLNNGDQTAFDEIYKQCSRYVIFICSKFCDDKEDAKEIVQDTFTIAFKKASELRGETLIPYLRKIAINRCYHNRNKNNRQREHVSYLETQTEDTAELDINFLPQEYLQNKEDHDEFLQLLKQLPPKHYEMIYLYYYVELTVEEIARVHNHSVDSVYKTLQRARKALKSKLQGKYAASMASVSIGAMLHMEEQAFAASHVGTATASTAVISTTAKSATAYTIAGIVVTACVVSAALYAAFFLGGDEPYEPTYQADKLILEDAPYEYIRHTILEEEPPELPVVYETEYEEEPEPEAFLATEETEIAAPALPQPEDVAVQELQAAPEEPSEPVQMEEPQEEPPPEPELAEEAEPEIEPEPEPTHIDRTPQILAALATAMTSQDVDSIIQYYGFSQITQMQRATGRQFWFYVTDKGSGDILVGTTAYQDGTGWYMRFEHFYSSERPLDAIDLLRFMD